MKRIIGAEINNFAKSTNNLPRYYGETIWLPSPEYKKVKTTGQLIAKRYNAILKTIKEIKGTIYILPDKIHVTYSNGNFTVQRDILTDTFLLPLLNNTY